MCHTSSNTLGLWRSSSSISRMGSQKVLRSTQYCRLVALDVNLNEADARKLETVERLHRHIPFNDLANAGIISQGICALDCSNPGVVRIEPHLSHASPVRERKFVNDHIRCLVSFQRTQANRVGFKDVDLA